MPLNDVDVTEISSLSNSLSELQAHVVEFEAYGFDPRVDLTPGKAVTITLRGFIMPEMSVAAASPNALHLHDTDRARANHTGRQVGEIFGLTEGMGFDRLVPAPEGQPISAGPSRSEIAAVPPPAAVVFGDAAETGGGQAVAAALPPAAEIPAAEPKANGKAPIWSEAEDARLVDLVANGVRTIGMSRRSAIAAAAQLLGRPVSGVEFRCYRKLKDRIAERIRQPATFSTEPASEAASVPEAAPAALPSWLLPQEAAPSVPLNPDAPAAADDGIPPDLRGDDRILWTFLQEHRPRWPMSAATDLELVEALGRGEKLPMIAADLGIDAVRLKERYEILTSSILNDRGAPSIDGQARLIRVLRLMVRDVAKT